MFFDDDVIYKDRFIWNRHKNILNQKNHDGISFEKAVEVFDDPYHIEEYDSENSDYEDRYNITGYVDGFLYVVVSFTVRDELIRIFSARKAETEELRGYYENVRRYLG